MGIDGLASRIRGMFAFGLWDDSARKLFLVRDRLGDKPLVFALRNKQIAFASTVRALRPAGFVSEIDEQAPQDRRTGIKWENAWIYHTGAAVDHGKVASGSLFGLFEALRQKEPDPDQLNQGNGRNNRNRIQAVEN